MGERPFIIVTSDSRWVTDWGIECRGRLIPTKTGQAPLQELIIYLRNRPRVALGFSRKCAAVSAAPRSPARDEGGGEFKRTHDPNFANLPAARVHFVLLSVRVFPPCVNYWSGQNWPHRMSGRRGASWRALRLCVSYLAHAKAQSPQSGNDCSWYWVAAMPRWVLSGRVIFRLAQQF